MKTPLFLFFVLIILCLLSFTNIQAESPFQTKIIISSDYMATIGKGGERRNNVHEGVDCYAVNYYGLIRPIKNGVVTKIGIDRIYGKYVEIRHEDERGEFFSFYAHGKKIFNSANGKVTTNTALMIMGSTGYSDSPHLHLEIYRYVDGVKVNEDPKPYISYEWIESIEVDEQPESKIEKIESEYMVMKYKYFGEF